MEMGYAKVRTPQLRLISVVRPRRSTFARGRECPSCHPYRLVAGGQFVRSFLVALSGPGPASICAPELRAGAHQYIYLIVSCAAGLVVAHWICCAI
eukprot:scaffold311460_cov31-Tisochrysis_lutea.AAC.1